ncbi:MAG: acyl-CoA thioesterase [Bacteroidota bacterium]
MNEKPVSASQVSMTQLVLPNDTNLLGNLLGGQLMHWIDLAAAIAAQRHTQHVCVTASLDELVFLNPIKLGEVILLMASVNRVFKTSLEIGVKVITENPLTGIKKHSNTAYLTFVAVDENGKPIEIFPIKTETKDDERRFENALLRREERLRRRSLYVKQK